MSCTNYEDALLDLARGGVAAGDEARIRAHLARCGPCAARLEREIEMTADLRALAGAAAEVLPSSGMEDRLLAEFERLGSARDSAAADRGLASIVSVRGGWRAWRPWLAAAAAAVLLIAAGAGAWLALSPATESGGGSVRPRQLAGRWVVPPALSAPAVASGRARGDVVTRDPDLPSPTRQALRRPAFEAAGTEFVAWPGSAALPSFESGQLVRTELPVSVVSLLGLGVERQSERATVVADVIVGQDGMPRAVRVAR